MLKKTKRVLALAMSVFMLFTVMTACGTKTTSGGGTTADSKTPADTTKETSTSADTKDTAKGPDISQEVKLKWMYHGSTVTDDKAVMEKANAYLKEKINATLEVVWCTWANFDEKARLAINGNDPTDIYFTSAWSAGSDYPGIAKRGQFARLDNPEDNLLEKYAPKLFEVINPVLAQAAITEGAEGMGVYGVPTYKEISQQYMWDINVTMLKKYGFTPDDVKDFYELGPIFEKIKLGEGKDFYPFNPEPAVLERLVTNSDVVDTDLILTYQFDPVDPTKSGTVIKSRYETPEYKKFVEKMREYYQKGYISAEYGSQKTMANARTASQLAAKYAIGTQTYFPGYEYKVSPLRKTEVVFKPASAAIISTTPARGAMHAISTVSKNKGRALMFLNLMNTDSKLITLLDYGIDGTHYTTESDGSIKLNLDMRKQYNPWAYGMGKVTNLPLTTDDPKDLWELFDKFNTSGKPVPILGWALDKEPVKNEFPALINIGKEYADALDGGIVDPAVKLPEFIAKLKANGIDKVTDEANKQLKAFLDAKK